MEEKDAVTELRCWDHQEEQRGSHVCPGTYCLMEVGAHGGNVPPLEMLPEKERGTNTLAPLSPTL